MLRRDVIMIALSPSCLRVATLSGRNLARVECLGLDPSEWESAWAKGLRALDEPLKTALKKLRIRPGAHADVTYQSPQSVAEVFSAAAGGKAALQAASLALRENAVSRDGPVLSCMKQLHRDEPGESATPPRPAKSHVLTIADSPACADTIAAWVRRAGIRPVGLLPSKAGQLALAVKATAELNKPGTSALLWIGDHGTVLVGKSDGALAFVRSIDFGFGLLADAYMRGARNANPEMSLVDRMYAYRLLFEAGIPKRGQTLDASIGLRAESVLPLMQSVLQRYVVETRQTLRFSIADAEAARATLFLAGPGAQIPGLAQTLAGQFDITVEPLDKNPVDTGPLAMLQRDAGEIADTMHLDDQNLRIHAPAEVVTKHNERLNAVLRVGAVAALLSLSSVAGWAFARNKHIEQKIASLAPFTDEMAQHENLRVKASQMATSLGSATQAISSNLGDRPSWLAGLGAVSRLSDETIELSEVTGAYPSEAKSAPVLKLTGIAWPALQSGAKTDTLGEFLGRLARNPLVDSAKVVSTRAGILQGAEIKHFVIAVQLKALPPRLPWQAGERSAAGKEPTP